MVYLFLEQPEFSVIKSAHVEGICNMSVTHSYNQTTNSNFSPFQVLALFKLVKLVTLKRILQNTLSIRMARLIINN